MPSIVLIHGGLYEGMTPARFWDEPGVIAGLRDLGRTVLAPARLERPTSWVAEVRHIAQGMSEPSAVVAGSNGCSAAIRLAVDFPDLVRRLVLCWPATHAADVDREARELMARQGVSPAVASTLLAGETLRGCADSEIAALTLPVAVVPSDPENGLHRRATVDALLALLQRATLGAPFPEPPRPTFAPRRDAFVREIVRLIDSV